MTPLWKGETLTNMMEFTVLLYDPHKCHKTNQKVTPTNKWKYGGSFEQTKIFPSFSYKLNKLNV